MNKKNLRENMPYGNYVLHTGERISFNRLYQPLRNKDEFIENIERNEYYYKDGTPHKERLYNIRNGIII